MEREKLAKADGYWQCFGNSLSFSYFVIHIYYWKITLQNSIVECMLKASTSMYAQGLRQRTHSDYQKKSL